MTTTRGARLSTNVNERRRAKRFPMDNAVRIESKDQGSVSASGDGSTINMSSSGLLCSTDEVFKPDQHVEVSVAWPAELDGKCRLKLVVGGSVVRCEDGQLALRIKKSEFRTMGAKGL